MTNAQTEARALLETAGARFPDYEEYDAAVAVIATALEAQAAKLAAVQRQIVAAWNAFGPSSSRNDPPAFDVDDLEHLPITAGGGLDEQIRELEERSERTEAALAEARKALELAVTKEMVNAAYNEGKSRSMTGMPNDFRAVVHAALKAAMEAGRHD